MSPVDLARKINKLVLELLQKEDPDMSTDEVLVAVGLYFSSYSLSCGIDEKGQIELLKAIQEGMEKQLKAKQTEKQPVKTDKDMN